VARTVADLVGAEQVDEEHISDALCLRAGRDVVTR
jgi:predicted ATPase with chaperone activity